MKAPPTPFLAAHTPLEKAHIVIIGAALEKTVSWRGGPSQAPAAIRLASDSVESYSALFGEDLAHLGVCDLGDVDCRGTVEEALHRIAEEVRGLLTRGLRVLLLGGEHTVTLGAMRGARQALGKLQLLVFDAHTDLRDEYQGLRISHATVTRRCLEVAERVVIVGARSFYGGEVREPLFASLDDFATCLDPSLPLYLSLDLDVLDPSQCPGVTNPEPGGLGYLDIIEALRKLRGRFDVAAMDIVELAPPYDPSGISAVCAAKLALEAMVGLWGAHSAARRSLR